MPHPCADCPSLRPHRRRRPRQLPTRPALLLEAPLPQGLAPSDSTAETPALNHPNLLGPHQSSAWVLMPQAMCHRPPEGPGLFQITDCFPCSPTFPQQAPKVTPRFLMALLSSFTTSIPSTPLALNLFVQVIRMACKGEQMGGGMRAGRPPEPPGPVGGGGGLLETGDKAEAQRGQAAQPRSHGARPRPLLHVYPRKKPCSPPGNAARSWPERASHTAREPNWMSTAPPDSISEENKRNPVRT